jgi:hypothetical protein
VCHPACAASMAASMAARRSSGAASRNTQKPFKQTMTSPAGRPQDAPHPHRPGGHLR